MRDDFAGHHGNAAKVRHFFLLDQPEGFTSIPAIHMNELTARHGCCMRNTIISRYVEKRCSDHGRNGRGDGCFESLLGVLAFLFRKRQPLCLSGKGDV